MINRLPHYIKAPFDHGPALWEEMSSLHCLCPYCKWYSCIDLCFSLTYDLYCINVVILNSIALCSILVRKMCKVWLF